MMPATKSRDSSPHERVALAPVEEGNTTPLRAARSEVSRRKILYIVDSFEIGGTESQAVQVAVRMHKRGHRVTIGALSMRGPLQEWLNDSGVPVISLAVKRGLLSLSGLARLISLVRFLSRNGFDFVHAHDLWSNLLAIPAARLAGIPVIASRRGLSHGAWFSSWRGTIFRWMQRRATFVLTNSTEIRSRLISEDELRPEQVRVVHNGVAFDGTAASNARRADLLPQLQRNRIVVMVANMYYPAKGHAQLIAAAPKILAADPEVAFVLVGDGYIRERLEQQTRERGVDQACFFLGRRTDVAELLACCDLAVLPSLTEGLPNSVLEYMCAGLPIVATSVGGIPELIVNNRTGILVPPGDSDALAGAVIDLLENPARARRLGSAAQERARREFSFARLISQLEDLYSS